MHDETIVKVDNVSKAFRLPHERTTSLKSAMLTFYRRRTFELQKTLNDISFEVKKGEFFGIVGRNGSGKSTLLKLLAGIYVPTTGHVDVRGSLVPFIELGVGFNPELTGRENVYLNGALLGFTRSEVRAIYDDIVTFAELERFMDQKLKNYSSGMQVRLAFSIAIRARQDILLVDEVLAVGDTSFQNKCYKTFRELKEQGRTIIFVTHDMSAVERFCDRVLVIAKGEALGVFEPREAATLYEEMNAAVTSAGSTEKRWGNGLVRLKKLRLNDTPVGRAQITVEQNKSLSIEFSFEGKDVPIVIGVGLYDASGTNMSGPNSFGYTLTSGKKVTFTIPKVVFNPGDYNLRAVIFDKNGEDEYDHLEEAATFSVISKEGREQYGKVNVFGTWHQ